METKRKEIQEYLSENVNIFVQPMVYQIVKKRPADPAAFAAQWLKDYIGIKNIIQHKDHPKQSHLIQIAVNKKLMNVPLTKPNLKKQSKKERRKVEWEFQKKFLVHLITEENRNLGTSLRQKNLELLS